MYQVHNLLISYNIKLKKLQGVWSLFNLIVQNLIFPSLRLCRENTIMKLKLLFFPQTHYVTERNERNNKKKKSIKTKRLKEIRSTMCTDDVDKWFFLHHDTYFLLILHILICLIFSIYSQLILHYIIFWSMLFNKTIPSQVSNS